jgi:hypothetical protein
MAFSIYTQSKIAKIWQNYINDATKYFEEMKKIADKKIITQKDRKRAKIMLEIIIEEYKTLPISPLLPDFLKRKAKELQEKGKRVYERVFAKRDS